MYMDFDCKDSMQIFPEFFSQVQIGVLGTVLYLLHTTKEKEKTNFMSYYRLQSITIHKSIHKHEFLISRINYYFKYVHNC